MNYSIFTVKIIEKPIQHYFKNNIFATEIIVQIFPIRGKKNLKNLHIYIWGELGHDIIKRYKVNDYMIIEGYISLYQSPDENNNFSRNDQVQISVRKVYPFRQIKTKSK